MEQHCDLCNKLFDSTQIWAVANKRGRVDYRSFCEDCVDKKIQEVGRKEFEELLQIYDDEGGYNRHQYC